VALARIEILEGRSPEEKRAMMDAVRGALGDALRVPEEDPAVRLVEYPREQFSPPYPDRHSDRYTLVEVAMFKGRSLETKRRLYSAIVSGLARCEVPAEDVLVVLQESPRENWALGGIPQSEVDLGFEVEI
jgi:phenylpyruvate tautomerase PptA (4-oxalocrotonate tautomerase family)